MANKYGKGARPYLVREMTKQQLDPLPDWQRQKMLLIHHVAKVMDKQVPPHTTRSLSAYSSVRGQFDHVHPNYKCTYTVTRQFYI